MALTPAEKQRRYRERQAAQTAERRDVIEAALLAQVERAGELSDDERGALANKVADLAKQLQWRATKLAKLAEKLRPLGWVPPGFPPRR
jgi:hypothetical protein